MTFNFFKKVLVKIFDIPYAVRLIDKLSECCKKQKFTLFDINIFIYFDT